MVEGSLLETIQAELEMLEQIYDGDGVIEEHATESDTVKDAVTCVLKLLPNTGFNMEKVGLFIRSQFTFLRTYPFEPPLFDFVSHKGVDDDQLVQIKKRISTELELLSAQKNENTDSEGYIYDMHEKIREILTEYNDTLRGRCAICLENFCENEQQVAEQKFTDRTDLVRVDECLHRFHLICVYRDWFMKRKKERDEFGCVVEFQAPEIKRCPVCRREARKDEITYLRDQFKKHPELCSTDYY